MGRTWKFHCFHQFPSGQIHSKILICRIYPVPFVQDTESTWVVSGNMSLPQGSDSAKQYSPFAAFFKKVFIHYKALSYLFAFIFLKHFLRCTHSSQFCISHSVQNMPTKHRSWPLAAMVKHHALVVIHTHDQDHTTLHPVSVLYPLGIFHFRTHSYIIIVSSDPRNFFFQV